MYVQVRGGFKRATMVWHCIEALERLLYHRPGKPVNGVTAV